MSSMEPFDYRPPNPPLYIKKILVDQLTIVGVLAERASKIARTLRVSLAGLRTAQLPGALALSLDGHRHPKNVCTFEEDRQLALRIAGTVRLKLSHVGVQLIDSLREVPDKRGKRLREHDMVMEVLSGGIVEYLSVELKVRRLWSQIGRNDV